MRLSAIKLSSFKSFAEFTHLPLHGQLIGIVGPNGCGKSNIIDAIRWVLGERRADELRTDTMQDIIFSGNGERKASGRASVELVFDNHDQSLAGPWGNYAELSVKRVLTRDGTSQYSINQQNVRRRDVHTLFMGTGLGPRAYAVIAQGMITQLIEANPEELAAFLEEAAGVSQYKERRKETERHLAEAEQNIARVNDILLELVTQLQKLEAQAKTAKIYTEQQQALAHKEETLCRYRYQTSQQQHEKIKNILAQAEQEFSAAQARCEQEKIALEQVRQQHEQSHITLQQEQEKLGTLKSQAEVLQTQVQFLQLQQQQAAQQDERFKTQLQRQKEQCQKIQQQIASLQYEQQQAQKNLDQAQAVAENHHQAYKTLSQNQQQAHETLQQTKWQLQQQQYQLEQTTVAEKKQQALYSQLQLDHAAALEKTNEAAPPIDTQYTEREKTLRQEEERRKHQIEALTQALTQLSAEQKLALEAKQASEIKLAELQARHKTLAAIQNQRTTQQSLQTWLQQDQFAGKISLWQKIKISPGWEKALEAVLGEKLFALEIADSLNNVLAQPWPEVSGAIYCAATHKTPTEAKWHIPAVSLLSLIQCDDLGLHAVLADWLAGVYCADSLEQVFIWQTSLQQGFCLVLPEGHVFTRYTVHFFSLAPGYGEFLTRESELQTLACELQQEEEQLQKHRQHEHQISQILHEKTKAISVLKQEQRACQQEQQNVALRLLQMEHARQQQLARQKQMSEQVQDLAQQIAAAQQAIAEAGQQQETQRQKIQDLSRIMTQQEQALQQLNHTVAAAKEQWQTFEQNLQNQAIVAKELAACVTALIAQEKERQQEATLLAQEYQQWQAKQQHDELPQLLQNLAQAYQAEKAQEEIKLAQQATTQSFAQVWENRRSQYDAEEKNLVRQRESIIHMQLQEQEARLQCQQWFEQCEKLAISDINAHCDFDGDPKTLQQEISSLQKKLALLGPVHIAAIAECEALHERKNFLETQKQDLQNAAQTLQDAVQRIDRESEHLIQSTLLAVNEHLASLFQELFGGGLAYLALDAPPSLSRLQLVAQPPGKKNTRLQLLSGGEKALVAIALIFAFFSLNPAPFCLLDEADAPLDDANTERYAKMVQRMSQKTQFIFISHNRRTMAIAEQLLGVTMQEKGVSRIVTVALT